MRKQTTKILTALLIGTFACGTVSAQKIIYDFKAGQLYYKITDDTQKKVEVCTEIYQYGINEYTSEANKPKGNVVIPATVQHKGVTYSVTSIGIRAFNECRDITSVTIPNSITKIEYIAFYRCTGLTSVTIPSSVTFIWTNPFAACINLTAVNVAAGNPNYISKEGVMYNKTLTTLACYPAGKTATSFTVPPSVNRIGKEAFSQCKRLTSVTLPNTLTNMEWGAFNNCTGLTSVTLPASVTAIENNAFDGCSGLRAVTVRWDTPLAINERVFGSTNLSRVTLHVPTGKINAYQAAEAWKKFGKITDKPVTSLSAPPAVESLVLYPNPASEAITITGTNAGARLSVSKLDGRTVMTTTVAAHTTRLDISRLPAGTYIVKAGAHTAKLVKK